MWRIWAKKGFYRPTADLSANWVNGIQAGLLSYYIHKYASNIRPLLVGKVQTSKIQIPWQMATGLNPYGVSVGWREDLL
jgi:hypothetical protein